MKQFKIFWCVFTFFLILINYDNSKAQTVNNISIDTLMTIRSYERPFIIDRNGSVIILDTNGTLIDFSNKKVIGFLPIQIIDLFDNDDYYICKYGTDDPIMTDSIVFYDKNFIHKKLVFERNKNMVFESEGYCPYSDLYQIFDVGKKSTEILCYYENCVTHENYYYLYDVFSCIETKFEQKHSVINSPDGYYYSIFETEDTLFVNKYDSLLKNIFRFKFNIGNSNIGFINSIINNRIIYSDRYKGEKYIVEINKENKELQNKYKISDIRFNGLEKTMFINDEFIICGWAPNIYNETFSDFETMPKSLIKIRFR